MPIYEIFSFSASDLLAQDHSAIQPFTDHISRSDGALEFRYGFVEEDTKKFYSVITWETFAHHKAVTQRPDYRELRTKLDKLVAGDVRSVHIDFEDDPAPALDSPVTEVTWFFLKEGITKATIKDIINLEVTPKILTLPGVIPGTAWDSTIEDPSKVLLFGGWEESKFHVEGTQRELFKEPFAKMRARADITIEHVSFRTAYKKA